MEEILTHAITNGDLKQASGLILLEAMSLEPQPHNIIEFYGLLNKAEEEARSIRTKLRINRYLQTIEKLHEYFIVQHIWVVPWNTFATYIKDKDILNTIDSLAEFFHSENPMIFLEKDFLEKLDGEFNFLLGEVFQSDLPKELKIFLIKHIENILKAIRKYRINGTEELKKAAQSLVSDLMMTEHNLKDVDKKNPIYTCFKAWGLSLLLYIAPSPYDVIGAIPDLHDFWIPKFEELSTGHSKIKEIVCETSTIQEAFEKSLTIFDRQQQKSITGGKTLKALPASKEDPDTNTDNKSTP